MLDLESHASIYDGARLSGAQVFAFRHNSPADLARKLARIEHPDRCLVVVEGLYSISGDLAPLADIASVCRTSGAFLMVDVCSLITYFSLAAGDDDAVGGLAFALIVAAAGVGLMTAGWLAFRYGEVYEFRAGEKKKRRTTRISAGGVHRAMETEG